MDRPAPWYLSMIFGRLSIVICLLLTANFGALAQAPQTVFIEELAWTELRDKLHFGHTTVLIPIGGTEQNGPHMALGKHNMRAKALSEKIARALGNALVAPVVAYVPEGSLSPPEAHLRFPGTITVPEATFSKVLEYAARSFKLHGFRDIVFLGDHGGYRKVVREVARRLNQEWAATQARTHAVEEYYQAAGASYALALKRLGYQEAEIGTHAGLADTSLTLALDPRMVRTERLQRDARIGNSDGVDGDPRRSSIELGQLGVEVIVAQTVTAIKGAVRRR